MQKFDHRDHRDQERVPVRQGKRANMVLAIDVLLLKFWRLCKKRNAAFLSVRLGTGQLLQ